MQLSTFEGLFRIFLPILAGIPGPLISSKSWKNEINKGGLFDMVEDFNVVFIQYCSSDAHMADTTRNLFGLDVSFRGRRIAQEILTSLIGNKENQIVSFGGCSAGARGSMVTIDLIKEFLPASTRLIGLHDSGSYVDIEPLHNYDKFTEQCRMAYDLYNAPEVNAECQEKYSNEPWRCLCGQYMLPLVQTESQMIIFQYDSYQVSNNIGKKPKYWTLEDCQYATYEFRPKMLNVMDEIIATGKHSVFGANCYAHCIIEDSQVSDLKIDGFSTADQFFKMINDSEKQSAISSCTQVNCESTCNSIELGQHSNC